jgi:hypothetical protein
MTLNVQENVLQPEDVFALVQEYKEALLQHPFAYAKLPVHVLVHKQ